MRDPLHRVSVRTKLALLFVGMSLLAYGLGGSLASRWAEEALETEILARLDFQCRAGATALDSALDLFARRAEDFASDGLIRDHATRLTTLATAPLATPSTAPQTAPRNTPPPDAPAPEDAALLADELRQHLLHNKLPLVPAFRNLAVTTTGGELLVSAHDEPLPSLQGMVPLPAAEAPTQVFGFTTTGGGDDADESPGLVLSTPLRDLGSTRVVGRLLALVRADEWMAAAVGDIVSAEHHDDVDVEFVLRDPEGRRLVGTLGPNGLLAPPHLHEGPHSVDDGQTHYAPLRGQFARSFPLSAEGWSAEISLGASRALAPVSGLRNRLIGVGLVLAMVSLLLLYFPLRFVARPLMALTRATEQLREGRLDTRVEVASEDEIGELGRAFNSMAQSIGERTQRLQAVASELREQQEELRAGRDRLQAVISSMQDGLVVLDARGKVFIANAAARPLLELIERGAVAIGHHLCRDEAAPAGGCFACLLDVAGAPRSCMVDAGARTFEVHTTPLPADVGGGRGRVLVAREVTDRIQRDEREIHNERLAVLGEVAAVMAHEINNPLTSISMFNQMLAAELPPGSPLRENTEVIARNTESAKRAIRELLDYATGASAEVGPIDIHDTLADVVRFLRPLSERAGVTVSLARRATRSEVTGDEVQLRQVFVNLTLNAIQAVAGRPAAAVATTAAAPTAATIGGAATGPGVRTRSPGAPHGEVVLETRDDGEQLIVDVRDTGPGIDPDDRERIFRPFFTTKPRGEGTGLGLPTTRRIAEMHGGHLTLVESSPAGTVFRVVLRARLPVKSAT